MFCKWFKRRHVEALRLGDTRICVPRNRGGKFASLVEAVDNFIKYDDLYQLEKVIQYNVPYRDYLREHGLEALIQKMCAEVPILQQYEKTIKGIRRWYEQTGKIADYDIQCYGIEETIEILDQKVAGLDWLQRHVQISVWGATFSRVSHREFDPRTSNGLYVGECAESYPQFDSYDAGDDRSYQNFIIRTYLIDSAEMQAFGRIPARMNSIRVHENIPEDMLPMVYYEGEGPYMLVATKKDGK